MPPEPGKSVTVSVPCSTSNLGPGFDCLGLAFNLRNEFTFTITEPGSGYSIEFAGPEKGNLTGNHNSPVFTKWLARLFREVGKSLPDIHVQATVNVPNARGLGSSSTAIAGTLVAGNHLLGSPLNQDQLLNLATELEGHPDNASPAILGGFTASVMGDNGKVMYSRWMPSEEIGFVILSPDYEVSTNDARRVIPKELSMPDAIANCSRMPLLIDAIVNGHGDRLHFLTQDTMHESYRRGLFRDADALHQAALDGGAFSVTTSGAGPSMLAMTPSADVDKIAERWKAELDSLGQQGRVRILIPASQGAVVEKG